MNRTLEEIIGQVDDIPAIPEVVIKTIDLLNKKEIDGSLIEKEILKDEGLTSTILKMANSAFYRGRNVVYTVKEALAVLGFNTVRVLIVSAAVSDVINKELSGYGYTKESIWKQSQICAYLSKTIAKEVGFEYPDTAYLVGLIKDIGMVIMDKYIREKEIEVTSILESEYKSQNHIEEKVLGYNHSEAGALLIKKWRLPNVLEKGVRYHHTPFDVAEENELQLIVHIADYLTCELDHFNDRKNWPTGFDERSLKVMGLNNKTLKRMVKEVELEIEAGGIFLDV